MTTREASARPPHTPGLLPAHSRKAAAAGRTGPSETLCSFRTAGLVLAGSRSTARRLPGRALRTHSAVRTAAPAFQECLKHLPRPPPHGSHAARPPRGRKPASQVSQHGRLACVRGAVGIPGETTVKPWERTDKGQVIFQKMLFNESWLQQAEQESSTVAFFPPRVPPSPVSSGRQVSRGPSLPPGL